MIIKQVLTKWLPKFMKIEIKFTFINSIESV
jgi:hypothetical protein